MPMSHMHPTPEPHALNMWSEAVEASMPDLVTEPIEFPCGTLFITMVSIVHAALATVVMSEPYLQVHPSLLSATYGHFIQGQPLQ